MDFIVALQKQVQGLSIKSQAILALTSVLYITMITLTLIFPSTVFLIAVLVCIGAHAFLLVNSNNAIALIVLGCLILITALIVLFEGQISSLIS